MSFQPTLRLLVDEQSVAAANSDPRAYQYSLKQFHKEQQFRLERFAQMEDIESANFTMVLVEDIATGERVRNFQTTIVARFHAHLADGTTEVRFKLGSGDIVAADVELI